MMGKALNLYLANKAIKHINITLGIISPNRPPEYLHSLPSNRIYYNQRLQAIREKGQKTLNHYYQNRAADTMKKYPDIINKEPGITNPARYYAAKEPQKHLIRQRLISNNYAVEAGVGNCNEKSQIAFTYLLLRGARPLERFVIINEMGISDHAFIVIGRNQGEPHQSASWNHEAVICDPWDNNVFLSNGRDLSTFFNGTLRLMHRYE
ncbi:hypothetical protein [Xenorhabdus doucetiae]|uniref:Transglutaminase-like domain-containing protein n=3 Tax=Xenorhabdus doucetiae TaxID=351671 RepID=A0A068QNZ1_9GAMM|nr:hypothetical protein [Xenorhabdus doucetiae]CDG16717.1 protein of unknown function [Xenorhabdus doucetiae]